MIKEGKMKRQGFIAAMSIFLVIFLLMVSAISSCAPATKNVFNVGTMTWPRTQNPFVLTSSDEQAFLLTYEALVYKSAPENVIYPQIAKSWEYDDENISVHSGRRRTGHAGFQPAGRLVQNEGIV